MYNPKEQVILRHLMGDTDLAKQYLPYLYPEYFTSVREGKQIFTTIKDYVTKYDVPPSYEEFTLELHGKVDPDVWQEIEGELKEIQSTGELIKNRQYVKDEIEAFVRNQYQYSVMLDMIQSSEQGKPVAAFAHKLLTPPLMDVVAPGIDTTSPDFISRMFAHNHETDCLIPFDIQWLNDTVRGVKRKTMNVILAPTNTGKSLFLCHLAASYMRRGLNVLYLSLEMDDWTVHNRVHANLLDTPIDSFDTLTEEQYRGKFQKIAGIGRLIVRDFPTGTAHTGHFRSYLAELKEKSAFVPDVIVVDYLNICSSERMNSGSNTPQYQVIGSIAKELRALAQQNDAVLWTATQANRSGLKGPVDLTNTSDSIQISYDADLVLSMWKDETLADYLHVSISKHRNGGSAGKHGMLIVNTSKMKLCDMNEADATEFERVKETYSKSKGKKAPTPVFDIDRN